MKTTTTLLALVAALTCVTAPVAAEGDAAPEADGQCPPLWFDTQGNPHLDPDCIHIPPSIRPLSDNSP